MVGAESLHMDSSLGHNHAVAKKHAKSGCLHRVSDSVLPARTAVRHAVRSRTGVVFRAEL